MSIKNINSEKENIKNYQNTCSEFIKVSLVGLSQLGI